MQRALIPWLALLAGCDALFALKHVDLDRDASVPPIDAQSCTARAIVANAAHTCVLRGDSSVACWGNNSHTEVAAASQSLSCQVRGISSSCVPQPAAPELGIASALGMSDEGTCAMTDDGVYCWGRTERGDIVATPTLVPERAGTVQLRGGETHICSRSAAGDVLCAGLNPHGEVGNGTTSSVATPTRVLEQVTDLTAAYWHTCAIKNGEVWCWGENMRGQVSSTLALAPQPSPQQVPGVAGATRVTAGVSHSCALLADKTVVCWGDNEFGQLGIGVLDAMGAAPRAPTNVALDGVVELVSGVIHSCARKMDGTVWCWGDVSLGFTASPKQVTLARAAIAIAAGSYHDCAILDDGTIACWGWNAYGQLGNGTLQDGFTNSPAATPLCARP
jgi:alpha-tubulin suppressor-like RCC1 family protein